MAARRFEIISDVGEIEPIAVGRVIHDLAVCASGTAPDAGGR